VLGGGAGCCAAAGQDATHFRTFANAMEPAIEDAPAPRYSATFPDNCASRGRIRCEDDGRASMLIIYALVVHGEDINVDS
jgi:hypothetical protein